MTKNTRRKLAAVLAADVAGHGRPSPAGGESTHRASSADIDANTALIDRCNGKVLHIASDAALADEAIHWHQPKRGDQHAI